MRKPRRAVGVAVFAASMLATACQPARYASAEPTPALHLVAHVLKRADVPIRGAYALEGIRAIEDVELSGDPTVDRARIDHALAIVDDAWTPVWPALERLRSAELAYNEAIGKGEAPSQAAAIDALCGVWSALPGQWRRPLLGLIEGDLVSLGCEVDDQPTNR